MQHFSLKISGKVQGVFYRASTKDMAEELGITGFVRNESDDSVYVECEGEDDSIKEFIFWCHHGPSRAKVEKVEVQEGEVKGFSSFEISR